MPSDKPPIWVFNTSAPDKRGLLEAFGATTLASAENFIAYNGTDRLLRIVRNTGNENAPHEDVSIDGANLILALGPLAVEPTDGNSNGEYNGSAVGLSPLPAGATAAEMELLLNANPGIAGEGGVTVTKGRSGYRVEWDDVGGPRGLLEWFAGSLTPAARVSVVTLVEGDVDRREVKVVRIVQDYWSHSEEWDLETGGAVTYTELTPGGDGVREVAKIVITGVPTSGQFRLVAPQSAIHKITAVANSQASKAVYTFTWDGNTIVSGDYVDVTDGAGPVRIWFNIAGAGGAPAVPGGGRLKEIAAGTNLTADIGPSFWAAFAADSGLEQSGTVFGYSFTSIRNKTVGHVATPTPAGFLDFDFFDGNSGRLDGTFFSIYDAFGQVGVWFNVSGVTEIPAAVALMPRSIEITTVVANDSANNVATAVKNALDADAQFTAVVAANIVTVTDAIGGPRTTSSAGTAPFSPVQTSAGYIVTASLPYNATAAQMRDALNNLCDITRTDTPDSTTFTLTFIATGAQPNIAASDINLGFSRFYRGSFSLNSDTMLAAFEETEEDFLTGILQLQYQYPGEDPVTFYYNTVTVYRSLIDGGSPNPINTIGPSYAEGEAIVNAGDDFVDVVFAEPMSAATYTLITAYLENSVDAPPDVIFTGVVTDKTVNGYRHYLSGAPVTANFVYKYIARLIE